ncbi:MAG: hypothetical protein ACYDDF_11205 [Thermoplasmatota archaeon]
MAEKMEWLHHSIEAWLDSESKVRLLVFFRQNPGLIDTLQGLAQRLAVPPGRMERDVERVVELGLVKEREISGKKVYYFERMRAKDLEALMQAALDLRREAVPA